ncbi:TIGR00374 family protein [Pseudomonas aeruginosa]|uniref:lysylphosphatidylglycerol synthase transmembrane domain-containing protein n=1 Tax=Pseudomonas aeruginosa TaxID=287 RepID=UPI000CE369DF|nr:lysylphosphatidylglycerol synthase transmembrane domain-containing protein [Pseudomonas aeruginosa]PPB21867.1 TIGR00374 family protein [Pseudomonas aeruginosa]
MSRGWLLLFGLIGASLIPLVLGGSDMFPRLRAFPLDSLLLMFGMIVVCWFINGLRLRLLLAGRAGKLGQLQSVGIIMASEFAFCATPGGSGGPLTLMALLARRGLRPAQTSAVFAVDQLADLTFFLCALGAILIYALSHSLSPNMESSLIFSAVFLIGLFVGAVMLIRYLHQVIRFNGRVLARLGVSSRKRLHWGRKILHFRIALHDSLRLPKRRLLAVFLLSSTHWLLRFSVLDLTLRGLGVDIQWTWTFLIQMVSLSAGQLSLIPGGAGGTELTSAALLAPMIGKSTAAAAIVIWRAVTFYFYLVAGGPVFAVLAGRPLLKKLISSREASS